MIAVKLLKIQLNLVLPFLVPKHIQWPEFESLLGQFWAPGLMFDILDAADITNKIDITFYFNFS